MLAAAASISGWAKRHHLQFSDQASVEHLQQRGEVGLVVLHVEAGARRMRPSLCTLSSMRLLPTAVIGRLVDGVGEQILDLGEAAGLDQPCPW
jgi:hypothetical protein